MIVPPSCSEYKINPDPLLSFLFSFSLSAESSKGAQKKKRFPLWYQRKRFTDSRWSWSAGDRCCRKWWVSSWALEPRQRCGWSLPSALGPSKNTNARAWTWRSCFKLGIPFEFREQCEQVTKWTKKYPFKSGSLLHVIPNYQHYSDRFPDQWWTTCQCRLLWFSSIIKGDERWVCLNILST